ncbi:MAG: acetate--CoA ligase [Desulfomonile tiedjei]|nr:acetate--CoA ligase [Desulfomonile tiedjei]
MDKPPERYDAHLTDFKGIAYIEGIDRYQDLYTRSIEDVEGFWAEQAREYLSWEKEWDSVLHYDFEAGNVEWFRGAVLNASFNCLDRHLGKGDNRVAYYWEGDDPAESRQVTFRELYRQVNRFAGVLKSRGVRKGDRVVIYLPMIVELPVAMLACARIGAVHCVVFSGFGSEYLTDRIRDSRARTVVTADGSSRGGSIIRLKENVDHAVQRCPDVDTVIVFDRCGLKPALDGRREIWWHEAVAQPSIPDHVAPEPMEAEDPLFLLYTSSSTGRPLGLVHTHGGYLLYAAMTTHLSFDLKPHETFWSTPDVGWITGHTYGVYGPLLNGLTSVLFEGVPRYPDFDRYWSIVAKYRVNKFYTAPTVIRLLAQHGTENVTKHDTSSLKLLGSVGQPIDPEAWMWYHQYPGRGVCPIIDTWWQTESGGHMITPLPGVAAIKPGSCSFPFMGVDPVLIDPDTGDEVRFPNQEGALFIRKPWPGMARTAFEDHERFRETYFARFPGLFFTGDAAKRDEDGYYWITGRIDEVINVSGYRMGPAEVEAALVLHPQVTESAVVGFPHRLKGQGIYAFVTLAAGSSKSDKIRKELIDLVRTKIGPIATPEAIQWADGLPKTRSGKVLRQLLQKIAAGNFDNLGDTSIISEPAIIENLIRERMGIDAS